MVANTKKALNTLIATIKGVEMTYDDFDKAVRAAGTTLPTLRKYGVYEQYNKTVYTDSGMRTIEDVLEALNSCAGDDCYYGDWNYQLIDGIIYDVEVKTYCRLIKLKED